MTRPRRQSGIRWAAVGLLAVLATALAVPAAATTERIVVDPYTGLAIGGVDPVSYFTPGPPRRGIAAYEYSWAGAIWRFANAGNLAAFREAPEVYAPRFGGHCAMAAARNAVADGNPFLWRLRGDHLYLFYSPANRAAFDTDPDRWIERAGANWPGLEAELAR